MYEKYISYIVEAENHDKARKKYLLGEGNREWVGPEDNSRYSSKDGEIVSIEELITRLRLFSAAQGGLILKWRLLLSV